MTSAGSRAVEFCNSIPFTPEMDRLVSIVERAGLQVFARTDHAAGAREAGLAMLPTVVLLDGNTVAGAPVMLAAPGAALELPLRVRVMRTPKEAFGSRSILLRRRFGKRAFLVAWHRAWLRRSVRL